MITTPADFFRLNPSAIRYSLAQALVGDSKLPRQALESCLTGITQGLKVEIPVATKERVLNAISPGRIEILKDTFMQEFFKKIIGNFNDEQIIEMRHQHQRTGAIGRPFSTHVQNNFRQHRENIIATVMQKGTSMTKELIPEVLTALRQEGVHVQLPSRI